MIEELNLSAMTPVFSVTWSGYADLVLDKTLSMLKTVLVYLVESHKAEPL